MELNFDLSFEELLAQIRSELPEEEPAPKTKKAVEPLEQPKAVTLPSQPIVTEPKKAVASPPEAQVLNTAVPPKAMAQTVGEPSIYQPKSVKTAKETPVPTFKPIPTKTAETSQPEAELTEEIKVFDPSRFAAAPKPTVTEPPKSVEPKQEATQTVSLNEPLTAAQREVEKTQPITFRAMQNSPLFFERSGMVTGKSKFGKTADLSAIPSIMAAEEALSHWEQPEDETNQKRTEAEEKPSDDAQMILPGFKPEPVKRVFIDEAQAEDNLKENRSRKVDSFRLEGVEEKEKEISEEILDELAEKSGEGRRGGVHFSNTKARLRANFQGVEYNRTQDKRKVYDFLNRRHFVTMLSTVVSALCALGLLFTGAIPETAGKISAAFAPEWLGNMPSAAFLSLLLLVLCAFAGLPIYSAGITCFFRGNGKPNARTAVFAALLASFIQLIEACLATNGNDAPCFAMLAAVTVVLFGIGNLISLTNIGQNFIFLSQLDRHELFAADTIENAADIRRLAQDSVIGDTDIRYSSRAKFASGFLSYSFAGDSTDDLCAWLMPVGCAASLLIAVIVGLAKRDVSYAFSIFSCAMCMSVPVSSAIALALPLGRANKKLREDGAFLSSYAAAFEYETTNAVALEAEDIFPAACCDLHGIKRIGNMRLDEVTLTAASMIMPLGGPIAALFNEVIMGRNELLAPVEDLMYEDRLGLAGWIQERKVFLGNRKMMDAHGIVIPPEVNEARYRQKGRRILYLADNGKLVAFLVVGYGSDIRIAEQIAAIEESGINLLVRTTDPNITENAIALTFNIPQDSVKVVSRAAGEVLKAYSTRVKPKAEAKLVHNGSPLAFLHAVRTAGRLCSVAGRINAQQIACCAAGLAIVLLLALLTPTVSPLIALLCNLLWVVVGLIVGRIGRE
ncbi:MAG TPA: hypothetical protein DDY98_09495 [Ruminococcaceae bacterium]|nr:hypothetical protein [Oscillospiraceae bacterium]